MSDMSEAPNFATGSPASSTQNLDLLAGVSLRVSVEVGSASIPLSDILGLAEGSVVELDRQANDLLDIFANGTLIARGEIVTNDGRYGIRVAEIASQARGSGVERRG